MRIDTYAAQEFEISRSQAQKYIEEGHIKVNLKTVQKRYIVKDSDVVTCAAPEPEVYKALPEPIPLDIVYEDADVIIVNKQRGLVVHPAPGHYTGTLVNALLYHCRDLSGINGELRPGIVHRLDKDTTGLIAIAKNDRAHHGLAAQLADRSMGRIYNALVHGLIICDNLSIDRNIGRHPHDRKKMAVLPADKGKTAVTHITVLDRFDATTMVEARLETGRTHQIRVHLAHIGHPVLGDPVYGRKSENAERLGISGQLLHSRSLRFIHPVTGKEMFFDTEPDFII